MPFLDARKIYPHFAITFANGGKKYLSHFERSLFKDEKFSRVIEGAGGEK